MQPLQGITVVTLEHAIAAPFCTRQLADLGARVIKVERPASATSPAPTTSACAAWPRTSSGPTAARKA
jgi:crotonobetainyl-CoA:carnitine CoA-transferase CaiB-like acyl-CoA transferase